MIKFMFLFFSIFLYGCNTSSYNAAYQDYYKYQQIYINALLDNNKKQQEYASKELIKCGKFLGINNPIKNPTKSKYVKIKSSNPLKIYIPSTKIHHFTIKRKNVYKEVIDIQNALTKKYIRKKLKNNLILKIGQFKPNIVRIVIESNKKFPFKYKIKNQQLSILTGGKNFLKKQKIFFKPTNFNRKKIIVIDPGHGGIDAGGIGLKGRKEKVAVLNIAKKVAYLLKKQGYIVYLTRKKDRFISLKKRTHFANIKKADLFLSIHCNIAPHHIKSPNGIEVYYLSPTRSERAIRVAKLENKEVKGLNYLDQRVILGFLNRDRIIDSHKLGIDIINGILSEVRKKGFYLKNGGVRPAPFWVLVGTQMPSILIETGYLTNPNDSKNLFNPLFQWQMAKGIVKGIENYFKKNN